MASSDQRNMQKACIFSSIFRIIDDLFTFRNDKFENNYNDVHPNQLVIKKEDEDPCETSFLYLAIEVYDRKLTTKILLDTFPFYINCIPYLHSKISYKMFRASVGSEIVRIARATTYLINIVTRVNLLLIQLKKQGGECFRIRIILLLKKIS